MRLGLDFEKLVESSTDMVFRTDESGNFLYLNAAVSRLTGYSTEELAGLSFFDLVDGQKRILTKKYFKSLITGEPATPIVEVPIRTKNDSVVWINQNVEVLRDKEPLEYSVIARDITAHIKLAQEKENWILRFSVLMENLQEGILMEDENRKILFVNRSFCDLFSVRLIPEDLIGKDYRNAQNHIKGLFEDQAEFIRLEEDVVNNKHIVIGQTLKLKNGRVYERDFVPIYIETGYTGNVWKYRDSTEKIKTRIELIKAKNNYQNVIETMRLGLLEVDKEDRIMHANRAFCEILGYESPKELIGKKSFETLLDEEQQHLMKVQMATREKGSSNTYEIKVKRADGGSAWMLISGASLLDENENVVGSVGVHLDITYQKRVAMELEEKKALKNMMEWQEKALVNLEEKVKERTSEVLNQKEIIEQKSVQITQSIEYAFRIQQALLPPLSEIRKTFPGSFIINKPMDIVGGDFYYFKRTSPTKCLVCVADSTGHGVPGGFMSMLGFENLKEAIAKGSSPGEILSIMNGNIRNTLNPGDDDISVTDGYDIAVCLFHLDKDEVEFAGANRPLFISRRDGSEIEQIKGTRASIGGRVANDQEYETLTIELNKGDTVYLFTDGCSDQFNPEYKRLGTKKFCEALLAVKGFEPKEQQRHIERFIETWQDTASQTDDILMFGLKY